MKPMIQTDHEDDGTRECPCGRSKRVSISTPTDELDAWMKEHTPHTNGVMVCTTDHSWSKFFSSRPKDYEVKLVDEQSEAKR